MGRRERGVGGGIWRGRKKNEELTQRALRTQRTQRRTKRRIRRTRLLCARMARSPTLGKILLTSSGNSGCSGKIFIMRNGQTRRRAKRFGRRRAVQAIRRLPRLGRRRRRSTT